MTRDRPSIEEFLAAEDGGNDINARLYRTIWMIGRFFNDAVDDLAGRHGLSSRECLLLMTVHRAGAPGVRPTELYRSLQITSGAVTKLLARLEARALIERVPDRADGRSVGVRLADHGRALVRHMFAAKSDINLATANMSAEEADELDRLLNLYLEKAREVRDTARGSGPRA